MIQRFYEAECGLHSLTIMVEGEADLDGTFTAIDLEEGDRVRLNGWLWSLTEITREEAGL